MAFGDRIHATPTGLWYSPGLARNAPTLGLSEKTNATLKVSPMTSIGRSNGDNISRASCVAGETEGESLPPASYILSHWRLS